MNYFKGNGFYVDSINGDDNNDGTTPETAWKTLLKVNEVINKGQQEFNKGGNVYLKYGSTFDNQYLHFYDLSGTKDNPIKVEPYGNISDGLPKINANGKGRWWVTYNDQLDNDYHVWDSDCSSAILLHNTDNIIIKDLEITNTGGATHKRILGRKGKERFSGKPLKFPGNEAEVKKQMAMKAKEADEEAIRILAEKSDSYLTDRAETLPRTGVAGIASKRKLSNIVIDGLYIHDIIGNVNEKHTTNGGIYFIVGRPEEKKEATGEIALYDGLTIKNCQLENVKRWGIAAAFTYAWWSFSTQNTSSCDEQGRMTQEVFDTYGNKNVVIENNYLTKVGGDPITTMYCDKPIVRNNVTTNSCLDIRDGFYENYRPNNAPEYFGKVAAGIWPWKCKDALFEYNECYNMENGSNGNGDGQAWDADSGDGTVYRYNYSHANTGGTVMFCYPESVNNIFCYNISYKDLKGAFDTATNRDAHIFNNTVILDKNTPIIVERGWKTGGANMENNIFYSDGNAKRKEDWNVLQNKTFDNNLYVNYESTPSIDKNAKTAPKENLFAGDINTLPIIAKPFARGSAVTYGNTSGKFDSVKLSENSSAKGAGKKIEQGNQFKEKGGSQSRTTPHITEKDFFGETVNLEKPSIGASEK